MADAREEERGREVPAAAMIAKRKAQVQEMEAQLACKAEDAKTVLAVIEKLWKPSGNNNEVAGVAFVLPNKKVLKGQFGGTWADLKRELAILERGLLMMVGPGGKDRSWRIPIPPFREPETLAVPKPQLQGFEEVPTLDAESVSCKARLLDVDKSTLPKLVAPKLKRPPHLEAGDGLLENTHPLLLCNKTDKELEQAVELCFGRGADRATAASFRTGGLVGFEKLERQVRRQRGDKATHVRFPAVELLPESDMEDGAAADKGLRASYAREIKALDKTPPLEDFLQQQRGKIKSWNTVDQKRALLINEKERKEMQTIFEAIALSHQDRQAAKRFKQIQYIGGVRRVRMRSECGKATLPAGKRTLFVEWKSDLGPAPIVDFLQVCGSEEEGFVVQAHDVISDGFVLELEGTSKRRDAPVQVSWRALHTDWATNGMWSAKDRCLKQNEAFVVEYPVKPIQVPALWSREDQDAEIEELVDGVSLCEMREFAPPPRPEVGSVETEVPLKFERFRAMIVLDCHQDMLMHDNFQRAKFLVRSLLQDRGAQLFRKGGSLTLVAVGPGGHCNKLELCQPDDAAIFQGLRWVASLETVAAAGPSGDHVDAFWEKQGFEGMHVLSHVQRSHDRWVQVQNVKDPVAWFDASDAQVDRVYMKAFESHLAKWQEAVNAYQQEYEAEEEVVRQENRRRLEEVKKIQEGRQRARAEHREKVLQLQREEARNQAVWKLQTMARVYRDLDAVKRLNVFLAISSATAQRRERRLHKQRAQSGEIVASVLCGIMDRVHEKVYDNAYARHEDRNRAIQSAAQAAQAAERARRDALQKDLVAKLNRRLEERARLKVDVSRRQRAAEQNERTRMAAEEAYQREVARSRDEMLFPVLSTMREVALRKRECMRELMLAYFGFEKQVVLLQVPQDPGEMLSVFMPLVSHQQRVDAWRQQEEERKMIKRLEESAIKTERESFERRIFELRAAQMRSKKVRRHSSVARGQELDAAEQERFLKTCEAFEAKLEHMVALAEEKGSAIQVCGWKLLLERAPFSKAFEDLRALVSQSRDVLAVLRWMEDQEADEDEDALRRGLETVSTDLGENPVNAESLRVLRSRLGVSVGMPSGDARHQGAVQVQAAANERLVLKLRHQAVLATSCFDAENLARKHAVRDAVVRRNKALERKILSAHRKVAQRVCAQNEEAIKQAKQAYQREVLEPLQDFNKSLETLERRRVAARKELKLLKRFWKNLDHKEHASSRARVSMAVLRSALSAAFSRKTSSF